LKAIKTTTTTRTTKTIYDLKNIKSNHKIISFNMLRMNFVKRRTYSLIEIFLKKKERKEQ
jgi:hypothetical protein